MPRNRKALAAIIPPDMDGRTREARQLKAEAAARQEIIDGLVAELGRTASMNDLLAYEDIAACTLEARRLEQAGKYAQAVKVRDQINRTRRAIGLKPPARIAVPKPDMREEMQRAAMPRERA